MAIVTVDEVEALSSVAFDTPTQATIETLIDLVQGEIEAYLARPIEPRTFTDEEHVIDYMAPSIRLDNTPIVSVDSVNADGTDLPVEGFMVQPWGVDLVGYGVWFPGAIGLPGFPGPTYDPIMIQPEFAYGSPGASGVAGWPYPGRVLKVTYTAGLDGANIPGIKSVLIRNVLRLWTWVKEGDMARGKFTSVSVEDFSARTQTRTQSSSLAQGFLEEADIRMLDNFRRKSIG